MDSNNQIKKVLSKEEIKKLISKVTSSEQFYLLVHQRRDIVNSILESPELQDEDYVIDILRQLVLVGEVESAIHIYAFLRAGGFKTGFPLFSGSELLRVVISLIEREAAFQQDFSELDFAGNFEALNYLQDAITLGLKIEDPFPFPAFDFFEKHLCIWLKEDIKCPRPWVKIRLLKQFMGIFVFNQLLCYPPPSAGENDGSDLFLDNISASVRGIAQQFLAELVLNEPSQWDRFAPERLMMLYETFGRPISEIKIISEEQAEKIHSVYWQRYKDYKGVKEYSPVQWDWMLVCSVLLDIQRDNLFQWDSEQIKDVFSLKMDLKNNAKVLA